MEEKFDDKLMTDDEVAAYLQVSVRTLQRLRKLKRIGYVRVTAKKKMTRWTHVQAYVKAREEEPTAKAA